MLKRISHSDEAAKDMVNKFCHQVLWLLKVRRIFAELFEDERSQVLMQKTAPSFFGDLNRILQGYLLLECAKITDPAKTGEKENFTIDNIIESIEWPRDIREELTSLKDKVMPFRNHILPARHKLLAHTDKGTFLADKTRGEFPEGDDKVFLKPLQTFCDVIHRACFGEVFGQISLAMQGDVIDLKGALEKAVAFNALFSESSGQEKTKLYSYLHEVRHRPTSVEDEAREEAPS